jgi:hypothetical protein
MKYGLNEVMDFKVFDKTGKQVYSTESVKENSLSVSRDKDMVILTIKDALFDTDTLKLFGEYVGSSDYEKTLDSISYGYHNNANMNVYSFGETKSKDCSDLKIIAKGKIRNAKTGIDEDVYMHIPQADVIQDFEFYSDCESPTVFNLSFRLFPDKKGVFYHLIVPSNEKQGWF